ncbi:MAG TPA: hypothetical protein VF941_05545 [Clostridia bacterium]
MRLSGKITSGTKVINQTRVEINNECAFRELLEACIIELCKELNIQVPMWLSKNTLEFSHFRRTSFDAEQFFDPVNFDKFEIRLEK